MFQRSLAIAHVGIDQAQLVMCPGVERCALQVPLQVGFRLAQIAQRAVTAADRTVLGDRRRGKLKRLPIALDRPFEFTLQFQDPASRFE